MIILFRKALSFIIVLTLVFTLNVYAQSDPDDFESRRKQLEEDNLKYEKILEQTRNDISKKEEYKQALEGKIAAVTSQINDCEKRIAELNQQISEKQAQVKQEQEKIKDSVLKLKERLRTLYISGEVTALEIILGAKNFEDFLDKVTIAETIAKHDTELIDSIKEELKGVEKAREELDEVLKEVSGEKNYQTQKKLELETLINENQEILNILESKENEAADHIDENNSEMEALENEITAYYAEQKRIKEEEERIKLEEEQRRLEEESRNHTEPPESTEPDDPGGDQPENTTEPQYPEDTPEPTGNYTWPVPGFYYLSSEWNEDRGSYNHGAIDIAGSGIMGASVVAAESGTVISGNSSCVHNWGKSGSCGCGGGFGNYLWIDHGDGKATIYAHLTSLSVSIGSKVKKGQVIGTIGSTGNSSGPHLHFETRLYGVKYNPMTEF